MPDARPPGSIRRRLLLYLIPSLSIFVVGASAATYFVALHAARSAYDRSLLDPALDMAANVTVDANGPRLAMLRQAQEALLYDSEDTVVFQVRAPDGAVVAGDEGLGMPPSLARGERRFFDGRYADQPVRVAAIRPDNGFYVQVAETLHKRNRLIWEVLAASLVPTLAIALATVALAWTGVAQGLAPLESVRAQLLGRSAQDLRPLDEHSAPSEIAPAIEALNRLLGRLREANEMQQRFLANAAHELRTPLAGLQMHLELLLRRDLPADVRDEVSGMHKATVRAGHLAVQLLALAKAEATTADGVRNASLDLYAVADRAAHEWVQRAIARDIDLGFLLEHAHIAGDPILLGELIDNLIDNALRYTPRGGVVTVRCGPAPDRPFLSVEDTGPGIPPSAHGRVFERFYRIQGTPGDGTGLGLAIVKEVAQRHGATLHVESPVEGHSGTRVVVRFPAPVASA